MNLPQCTLQTIYAIVCVVTNKEGKILILKRSPDKKYFPGKWAFVSAAPLEGSEDMEAIAKREIKDELGIEGEILKREKPVELEIEDKNWKIYPFLARVSTRNIILNEEHTEAKWVTLDELQNYNLIEGMQELAKELLK